MDLIICYLLIYLVEAFIAWQYATAIFVETKDRKTIAFVYLSTYFCIFLLSHIKMFWFNTLSFFVFNSFIFFFLYDVRIKHVLFYTLILTIIMIATELFAITVFGELTPASFIYGAKLYILIQITALSKLLYYVLSQILIRFFRKNKDNYLETRITISIFCLVPTSVVWLLLTFSFVCGQQRLANELVLIVITSTILLFLVNMCVFFIYTYQKKKYFDFMNIQLLLQKKTADIIYYKELLKQFDEQNLLIHDIKKHLYIVSRMVEERKYDEAKEFLDKLVHSHVLETKINICDNTVLNMILAHYVAICKKKNIALNIDIRKSSVDHLNPEELSSLFGNMLDNAIEGCCETKDSYIDLTVEFKTNQQATMISIINSCNQPPMKSKNHTFSTQKTNERYHGLGLKSVERVAMQYGGNVKAYYDEVEKIFHTIVLLYNNT